MSSVSNVLSASHSKVPEPVITAIQCIHCNRHAICIACSPIHCQFHTTTTCNYYHGLYAPGHRSHGQSPPDNRQDLCWCCTCIASCYLCTNRHCQFHKGKHCNMEANASAGVKSTPGIKSTPQRKVWKGIKVIDEYVFFYIKL